MDEVTAHGVGLLCRCLPPPPGQPSPRDLSDFQVVLIVVAVLGVVVLIAWSLRPLIVRRLTAEKAAGAAPRAEPTPAEGIRDISPEPPRHDAGAVAERTEPAAIEEETEAAPSAPAPGAGEPSPATAVEAMPAAPPAESEAETTVGITLTVRALLDHANAGQLLRGFALYSASYFERFRAATGLSPDAFEAEFSAAPTAPPDARAELAAVTDVETLPDGRVSAVVSYANGAAARPRPERYVFVRAETGGRWLIDDIQTLA